jgi:hypothetical protein
MISIAHAVIARSLREPPLANDICHVYLVNDVAKRTLLNLLARMIEERASRSRLDSSKREAMTGSEPKRCRSLVVSHGMRAGGALGRSSGAGAEHVGKGDA